MELFVTVAAKRQCAAWDALPFDLYKSVSDRSIHSTDMSLHRSLDEQTVLVMAIVLVVPVVLNSQNQRMRRGGRAFRAGSAL